MAQETFPCNNHFKQQNHPNSAAQPELLFSQWKNGKRERPPWALPSQSPGRRTDRRRRTSRSSSSRTPRCRTWGTCGCSSSIGTAKPNNDGHLCSFGLTWGTRNRWNEHFNMLKSQTAIWWEAELHPGINHRRARGRGVPLHWMARVFFSFTLFFFVENHIE